MSTVSEPVVAQTNVRQFRDERQKLKIKIKSLAAEARIIRLEEKKCCIRDRKLRAICRDPQWGERREELYFHRTIDLREEARASLIAYAFLRGKPLTKVDPMVALKYNSVCWRVLHKAARIVDRFGVRDSGALDPDSRAQRAAAQKALLEEYDQWIAQR